MGCHLCLPEAMILNAHLGCLGVGQCVRRVLWCKLCQALLIFTFILKYETFIMLLEMQPYLNSKHNQEIMILPIRASRFEEALQMGSETYHHLKVLFLREALDGWYAFNAFVPCDLKFIAV